MIGHSFIDFKYKYNNEDEKIAKQSTDSYLDNRNNEVVSEQYNECVICFEPVTDLCQISKFGCTHAKYMHENCVKNLRKCPLCRERSVIVESIRHRDTLGWEENVICFLLGFGFLILLFTAMYPMIILNIGKHNAIKNNSTMTNTTLR
tara:strand:+ start:201 stop:644 length:444 start_codon:yes stop_codon:yes gene_type:complete